MSTNVQHKSTAKSVLRLLTTEYGYAGLLALLAEVVREQITVTRGRPSRMDSVRRELCKNLEVVHEFVCEAEQRALALAKGEGLSSCMFKRSQAQSVSVDPGSKTL